MSEWYIVYNGETVGPMTKQNLRAYNPSSDTLVWKEGMINWQPIYSIPELMELISGGPATPRVTPKPGDTPPPSVNNYYPSSTKDKTTAGILALLLGWLGVQYFYLGKVGGGLVTILLTCITCFFLWPILTFIQGIVILTMSDEDFNRKFVRSDSFMPLF